MAVTKSPGATGSPRVRETFNLPSATVEVAMSMMSDSAPGTGAPAASGFAESRRSQPPCGATSTPPPCVFVNEK